jgi:hypothetical protein
VRCWSELPHFFYTVHRLKNFSFIHTTC